jgi:hypothetical protein
MEATAPTSVHLGFDMGIRNLAFCLMEHRMHGSGSDATDDWCVVAWDNVDLLAGGVSAQSARRCFGCGGPAAFSEAPVGNLWCKGCATGVRRRKTATARPVLPALPCGVGAKDLRDLGVRDGWATKKARKEELLAEAPRHYLMPWKAPKATSPSFTTIRRAMDSWLDRMLPTFAAATLIRLENQPVMKGPTMKSIQILLFTLLGHRLEREFGWRGEIVFVHAGVKTKGGEGSGEGGGVEAEADVVEEDAPLTVEAAVAVAAVATDAAAYAARKKTAETLTVDALVRRGDADALRWKAFFESRSKKSDLADAFLMALRK